MRVHPPPPPWRAEDLGAAGIAGGAFFQDGVLIVNGAGAGIGGVADTGHFVSQWMVADGEIVARVMSMQETNPHAQAGVMMRDGGQAVVLDVTPRGGVEFMARHADGVSMDVIGGGAAPLPTWLRLTRKRDTFTGAVSSDGRRWEIVGAADAPLGAVIQFGVVAASGDSKRLNMATFDRILTASQASQDIDIGPVGRTGSSSFESGLYTVRGSGAGIWADADAFHFLYQSLHGDGEISIRLLAQDASSPSAKAGLMIRDSGDVDAAHVMLDMRPDGAVEFVTRRTTGQQTIVMAKSTVRLPAWLKLVREGALVRASFSADGWTWTPMGATEFSTSVIPLVGVAVTSHDVTKVNTASFDNLTR